MALSTAVPDGRQLDAAAIPAALRRLRRGPSPPWLHGEAARRLGERLLPLRDEPRRILDWWAGAGGGAAVLRQQFPRAELVAVEAPSWLAGPGRPGEPPAAAPVRRRWAWPWRGEPPRQPARAATTTPASALPAWSGPT